MHVCCTRVSYQIFPKRFVRSFRGLANLFLYVCKDVYYSYGSTIHSQFAYVFMIFVDVLHGEIFMNMQRQKICVTYYAKQITWTLMSTLHMK